MLTDSIEISNRITVGPALDEEGLAVLKKQGFKTILNLSKKGEYQQPLAPVDEQSIVEELGMRYLHFPVSLSSLKPKLVDEILAGAGEMNGPVYVHCLLGQRSSAIGMILHAIRKKLSSEKVLDKADSLGLHWNAPFIKDFVRNYVDRQAKAAA